MGRLLRGRKGGMARGARRKEARAESPRRDVEKASDQSHVTRTKRLEPVDQNQEVPFFFFGGVLASGWAAASAGAASVGVFPFFAAFSWAALRWATCFCYLVSLVSSLASFLAVRFF